MTNTTKTLEDALNEAVRDVCDVSVAPAAKSEVRRILKSLIGSTLDACREKIPGESTVARTRNDFDAGYEQGWDQYDLKAKEAIDSLRPVGGKEV